MLKSGVIPESKRIQKIDEEDSEYTTASQSKDKGKRRHGILNMFFSPRKKPDKIKHLYATEPGSLQQNGRLSTMQDFANFTNEC